MEKFKTISLAASFVLAISFTFSCSEGSEGNSNISTCGGKEYNTTDYSCERGELVGSCRGQPYYPEYERCENGEIKDGTEISSSSRSFIWPSSSSVEGNQGSSSSSSVAGQVDVSSSSVGGVQSSSSSSSSDGSQVGVSSSSVEDVQSSSSSSSSVGGNSSGGYTGTYKTVVIGTQTWMAQNLNYDATGSKCYDNDPSNCETYGRLYNWATAMTVCPTDWHLPTQAEWNTLSSYVQSNSGCSNCDVKLLKATSGWNSNCGWNVDCNGTDKYGFSALPGGRDGSDGRFNGVGVYGNWWSSNESNATNAYNLYMSEYHENAEWFNFGKISLLSVRCIKD